MATHPQDSTSERLQQIRAEREADGASLDGQERLRMKELHWMRCCKCGGQMDEIVFRAVRVDKCLHCGGVYLDDGELEQLVGKPGWIEGLRKFFGS